MVFRSTESQMMAILAASLVVLFATMIVLELVKHDTPIETAAGTHTLARLEKLVPVLQRVGDQNVDSVVGLTS